jgi:hypothetical protein
MANGTMDKAAGTIEGIATLIDRIRVLAKKHTTMPWSSTVFRRRLVACPGLVQRTPEHSLATKSAVVVSAP